RSINNDIKANELVRFILEGIGFGGGHNSMAGGFLPLKNFKKNKSLHTFVRHRAITYVEGL
ncbi:MAG: DHH family phosphoesterase, partial [Deltaproteobacteria bacterium]|nr:DHH family phosphoesterase [Deltaproteobacteria bacterium]